MTARRATILLPCLQTGGTEIASLATARALQASGFAVGLLVYFDEVDETMLRSFVDAGVEVEMLGMERRPGAWPLVVLASALMRALGKRRHHVIWVQYMTPTLVPLLVARVHARRLVAAVHVAGHHYSQGARRRIRWLAKHWCSTFVCVSRVSAQGLFGPDRLDTDENVSVLPNTFDAAQASTAPARRWREELHWPANAVVVGYIGRLSHNKGADVLLEAVAVLNQGARDVRLVLVGEGSERARLQALAQQRGISEKVSFAGRLPRDQVYSALKGFDIAAIPSREEGFGLSALEAMAAGVPVVASNVDALAELVDDGDTGLLCAPEDPASLAAQIERLARDSGLRASIGARAKVHAFDGYGEAAYRAGLARVLAGMNAGAAP